jgi:flagellar biosynthesis protein FlhA
VINGIAMDPRLDQLLTNALQNQRESSPSLGFSPSIVKAIHDSLSANLDIATMKGCQPVVLCAATVRPYFYRLIHTTFPTVVVLSFTELPPETEIEFIGKLEVGDAN